MRHGSERDPVRDAQLGGHVSEAGVHGVRPDVQPPGHNTVGQSLGHQQTGLLIAVQKRCSARPGWPYAYSFSRHSYSAIRNSTTQRSDHTQRPRLFGTVAEPPLLCQEAGRIAWMSAIRI
jgi:hypothetical protein